MSDDGIKWAGDDRLRQREVRALERIADGLKTPAVADVPVDPALRERAEEWLTLCDGLGKTTMVEHAEEIIRGLLAALASVQARNPDNGSADEDRLNNAADLIRYLLGYDDEPDESTAGMIYDAIEGDDHAFRQVVSLARSPDNLTEALQEIVEMTEGHPGIARLHHIAKDALATGLPAGETTT